MTAETQLAPCATCGAKRTTTNMVTGLPPICPDCYHAETVARLQTPERRQSSPEHRERVHRRATSLEWVCFGNFEEALDIAREHLAIHPDDPFQRDVLSLLTRRAATVAGIRQPEAHVYGDGSNRKRDWRQP